MFGTKYSDFLSPFLSDMELPRVFEINSTKWEAIIQLDKYSYTLNSELKETNQKIKTLTDTIKSQQDRIDELDGKLLALLLALAKLNKQRVRWVGSHWELVRDE